ncbi:MAG: hypothetical protein QOE60_503, partial [Thermoleophilaceae bacterium]|nr:hypothetical protein [Thermoleophilaceae bacterium]
MVDSADTLRAPVVTPGAGTPAPNLRVPRMRQAVLANLAGSGWMALTALVCVPLYIGLMGIESYGLVGFFVTLVAVSSLLELGLGATLNRELARWSASGASASDSRDLVRTLEVIYWALAATMGVLTVLLAPVIANDWLRSTSLAPSTVQSAVMIMGLVLTFQIPLSLYSGGLRGLERQVQLNVVLVVMMTLRTGGAVLVLWLVSPTITAFFLWQLFGAACHTAVAGVVLWRALPRGRRPHVRRSLLHAVWRFAAGMSGTSILIVALTQTDKLILSNLLSLRSFGYYSLAALAAGSLGYLFLPVFQAAFPRFSSLVAADDEAGLIRIYHLMAQAVAVLIIPAALVGAAFSRRILEIWTGSTATADHTHALMSLLLLGTALNGLMTLPYALSLAYGWTRWPFYLNLVALGIFLPALVLAVLRYDGLGAAAVWAALNAGYVLIGIHTLHRRLLRTEKLRWYLHDVAIPLTAALAVVAVARLLVPDGLGVAVTLALLGLILLLATLAAAISIPGF